MDQLFHFRIEQELPHNEITPIWEFTSQCEIRMAEGRRYRLTATTADPGVSLLVGDDYVQPSRVHQTADSTVQVWNYSSKFFAGETEFKLVANEQVIFSRIADVSPDPRKLGRTHYQEMLVDLEQRVSSCLYGSRAANLRTKRGGQNYPPMAFLAQLSSHINALAKAFAAIERMPHRNLVSVRQEVKLHQVRKIDTATVRNVTRRPTLVAAIRGVVGARQQERINVPRREHTYDTAPNRIALGYLKALSRRCESLRTSLAKNVDPDGNLLVVEATKKERWADRLSSFQHRIDKLTQAAFLVGLKSKPENSGAYIAVSRHPTYNRFCRIARQILNPVTMLAIDSEEHMSLKSSYQLYEYWTFFALCDEIRKLDSEMAWVSDVGLTEGNLFHTLKTKSTFVGTKEDLTIKVIFQASFSSGVPYATTRSCHPDIVVEVNRGGWDHPMLYVFDAKYRAANASIQAGIDDMHIYRDSIRYSPDQIAIESAFILTPIETSMSVFDTDFQQTHGIGAIQFSPLTSCKLSTVLKRLVFDF